MGSILGESLGLILGVLCLLAMAAAEGERAAKLQRLTDLRRSLPHVSASALAAVLAEVRESGLPDGGSRWDLAQASEQVLTQPTPYGSVLDQVKMATTSGKQASLLVGNFPAMVWRAFHDGGRFTELVRRTMAQHPSMPDKPWSLALYADEVVPGNPLSNENRRKIRVVYMSFLEFGAVELSKEDNWFTFAVVRSKILNGMAAGIGQLFKQILHKLFGPQAEHDLSLAGLRLEGDEGAVHLWAVPGMFLQDGAAHKSTWHCKGDAGTKLCMLCRNLVSETSELTDEDGAKILTCSLVHEDDMDFATSDDIRGAVRRLAGHADSDTKAMFAKRQQAVGFTHQPHGLLMDPTLDNLVHPATQFVHDWMHGVFVNGIFQTVIYLVFEDLISDGVKDI